MVKAEIFGPTNYDSCANRVKHMTGILLIFHPGCGHCVEMRPAWEAMKSRLHHTKIVEVDGSAMSESPSMNSSPLVKRVRGFPSIFRVENGRVAEEYQGPRTTEAMQKFSEKVMKKKLNVFSNKNNKVKKSKQKSRKTKRRKLIRK